MNSTLQILDHADRAVSHLLKYFSNGFWSVEPKISEAIATLSDERSKDVFCRAILCHILRNFLKGDLPSVFSGNMSEREWQGYIAQARDSNIHPEIKGPADKPIELHLCLATTFILEQYRYEDIVKVEPGDVCLDFGACFGDVAIWMCENGAKEVHAFEIDRRNLALLQETLEASPHKASIRVVDKALGGESGSFFYHFNPQGYVGGNIKDKVYGENSYEVQAVTLDEFCEDNGIAPDFIKMDIEGQEIAAIRGAKNVFRKYRPKFAISIYHRWSDHYEIPLALKEICPNYNFYCKKSQPFNETILFGIPAERL